LESASIDPYDLPPPFWERHGARLAPAAVFVLTAVLAVLSFPPYKTPEFAYVCLAPGIFWAYSRPPLKVYAGTLFAAQALAWTVILGWLHNVTWVGLILLGPFVGAWVGLWYLAAWWVIPRMLGRITPVRLAALLGLAGSWVVIEWTRTWFLGGFEWLPLAASQWQRTSILQIASYTGAWGISFVLVAMNVGFSAYAHRLLREGQSGLRKRSQEFLLALFLLLVCLTVQVREGFNRLLYTIPFARVAFVQPDIPTEVKWDASKVPGILEVLRRETDSAASTHPDLILWPEAAAPQPVLGVPEMGQYVSSLSARAGAPILLGGLAVESGGKPPDERWYNAAFVIDPQLGLQARYYAKRKLVPFGEFIPLRPLLGWLSKVVPVGDVDFTPGTDPTPLLVRIHAGSAAFGTLICYEDVQPSMARTSVLAGADVLTVLTNNGWFGEGGAAYQHAAHSVLRAVETRRPVLRCGNAGWSGWIDEFGNIRSVLLNKNDSIYFRGTGTVNVTRDIRWAGTNSFYVRHGDWFVAVSASLALFAWFLLSAGSEKPKASPGANVHP